MCVRGIEESEQSCLCVLGVSNLSPFLPFFRMDFSTVPEMWYLLLLLFCYFIRNKQLDIDTSLHVSF